MNNTAPPRIFDRLRAAPECLAGVGRRIAVRPGRNHHHHVVEHLDLVRALAQATPDRNFDGLLVAAAAEHADVAILLDRSLELDSHQSVLGKGPSDFVMRDLDEIGLGEHTDHLLAQPAIVRLEILLRSAGPRIDLGVEVKIGLTQQIELFEILIVKQGAELAGKLPESRLLGIVEVARVHEAVDQIRLPQRNETIPLRQRGRFAGNVAHKPITRAGIAIAGIIPQTPAKTIAVFGSARPRAPTVSPARAALAGHRHQMPRPQ